MTVYVHAFFARSGYTADPTDPEFDEFSFNRTHRKWFGVENVSFFLHEFALFLDVLHSAIVIYLPKPKIDKRKSLLAGTNEETELQTAPVTPYSGFQFNFHVI